MRLKKVIMFSGLLIILLIVGIFVFTVFSNIKKFDEIQSRAKNNKIVKPKKLFLYSYEEKKSDTIDIESEKVFIHFWATWCKPCVEEFDSLNSALNYNTEFRVFFITKEDSSVVNNFLKNKKFDNIQFYGINKKDSIFKHNILPTTYYSYERKSLKVYSGKYDWLKLFKQNNNGKYNK